VDGSTLWGDALRLATWLLCPAVGSAGGAMGPCPVLSVSEGYVNRPLLGAPHGAPPAVQLLPAAAGFTAAAASPLTPATGVAGNAAGCLGAGSLMRRLPLLLDCRTSAPDGRRLLLPSTAAAAVAALLPAPVGGSCEAPRGCAACVPGCAAAACCCCCCCCCC
jgi:hypothetical protein